MPEGYTADRYWYHIVSVYENQGTKREVRFGGRTPPSAPQLCNNQHTVVKIQ